MRAFFQEFKQFVSRGNVLDLAIAVILGAAFGAIVTSFVNDVLMPPLGLLLGNADFSHLAITLKAAEGDKAAVVLKYGVFVNTVINFLIVAFAIFVAIKSVNKLKKKEAEVPKEEPKPTNEELLLTEIRDLLKKK